MRSQSPWKLVTPLLAAAVLCVVRGSAPSVFAQAPQAGSVNAPASSEGNNPVVKDDEEVKRTGEPATSEVCTQCHGLEDVTSQRRTVRQWNEVIAQMVDRGAAGTDEDIARVKEYLARFYGLVNANTATAAELSAVLGLSAQDADTVIQYRKAHGPFSDAAALSRVPGIESAHVDAHTEALLFN